MVLKGLNWVHNDKIGSNGLKRSQLGTQYKYRGYLISQDYLPKKVTLYLYCVPNWSFISLRNPWISVFDIFLLKVELEMWFLQFLSLNVPENWFFTQNWFLDQNLRFSSKSCYILVRCQSPYTKIIGTIFYIILNLIFKTSQLKCIDLNNRVNCLNPSNYNAIIFHYK